MANKGRVITYHIIFKHRGELSKSYLDDLKKTLWEYLGDVSKPNIRIVKVSNTHKK